jgi:hypothetical protein
MLRSIIATTAALAFFSSGLAISANARGGAFAKKYEEPSSQKQKNKKVKTRNTDLTEFSSSSAPARKRSSPGR